MSADSEPDNKEGDPTQAGTDSEPSNQAIKDQIEADKQNIKSSLPRACSLEARSH